MVWRDVYYLMAYCGQQLHQPPNVAGWSAYYQYPAYDDLWLDTATYPARTNTIQSIMYAGFSTPAGTYEPQSANLEFKVNFVSLVGQFTDPYDPNTLVVDAAELLFAIPVSLLVRTQLKISYLLLGQLTDSYWTDAYELYVQDPNTTDMTAQLVPTLLQLLFLDMAKAAEIQMH